MSSGSFGNLKINKKNITFLNIVSANTIFCPKMLMVQLEKKESENLSTVCWAEKWRVYSSSPSADKNMEGVLVVRCLSSSEPCLGTPEQGTEARLRR